MTDDGRVRIDFEGAQREVAEKPRGDRADHAAAVANTVRLRCAAGHEFSAAMRPEAAAGACGCATSVSVVDGKRVERPAQMELVCLSCGAALSCVGEPPSRACPRCGRAMSCAKCMAAGEDVQDDVRCPACGERPVAVTDAPPIRFSGIVSKVVAGHADRVGGGMH